MEQCDFLFSLCGKKNNQAETVFLCGKNSLTEMVCVWHPLKSICFFYGKNNRYSGNRNHQSDGAM
jgi:hypothetical protein